MVLTTLFVHVLLTEVLQKILISQLFHKFIYAIDILFSLAREEKWVSSTGCMSLARPHICAKSNFLNS